MNFVLMLLFLVIWLLILWFGSVALQVTGMEQRKARFQALSALTGTGFTTGEAESVVNHPTRRRIVSWLIVIGNTGVVLFIIAVVLFIKAALTSPSLPQIVIIVGVILFIGLFIGLGAMDKLSSKIVAGFNRKGRMKPDLAEGTELIHSTGDYVISRLAVGMKAPAQGCSIQDAGFWGKGITILAIERGNLSIPIPSSDAAVLPGDHLLCYGPTAAITAWDSSQTQHVI
jgi:glucan phosphoethanolaminetransferase (alkaline phosphatase superfamily)